MDEVRLPDLETIRRFSIAVRQEHAPVDEVIDALRTDLDRLQRAQASTRPAKTRSTPAKRRAR